MSKKYQKNKAEPKPSVPAKETVLTSPSASKSSFSFMRPEINSDNDDLYKKIFYALSIVFLFVTIFFSLGSGVNADDAFQVDYSEKIVKFYTSMGADASALNVPRGNMQFYGGFFEAIAGFVNKILGHTPDYVGYHTTRHILIAIFACLAMFYTGRTAQLLGGWRAGIMALVFIALTPVFFGHALMNPKDIPFAAGFIIGIYYMIRFCNELPKPTWRTLLGISLGLGIAFGMRAGGLLLFAYFFMYVGLDYLLKLRGNYVYDISKTIVYTLSVAVAGYILGVLFWPYALVSPFSHPFKALAEFESLSIKIRILFEGVNVMSDATPWYYVPLSIMKTVPTYILIGFAFATGASILLWKRYAPMGVFIVLFTAIFPVFYVIYKDSILHNSWRHLLFVYPSMVVAAALAWNYIFDFFSKNDNNFNPTAMKAGVFGVSLVVLFSMLDGVFYTARNSAFPYTYYRDGIKNAYGNFETDYWGVSTKQGVEWLENQGIIKTDMPETITIASNMHYPLMTYVAKKYAGKVKYIYVKYSQRYAQNWDYGLFVSNLTNGEQIRNGFWPEKSRTIHTIDADGVPLLTIMKQDTARHAFKASQAMKANDGQTAFAELKAEIAAHPDNELALNDLANVAIQMKDMTTAKKAIDESLKISNNSDVNNMLGVYYLNNNDAKNAMSTFQKSATMGDDNMIAYYYMANIQLQQKDLSTALKNAEKCIEINPQFKAGYELAARIYQQMGDNASAQRYINAANQMK